MLTFFPVVGIGTPPPLVREGGGTHSLAGEGLGEFHFLRETYTVVYTVVEYTLGMYICTFVDRAFPLEVH